MDLEEYVEAQRSIVESVVAFLLRVLFQFRVTGLTRKEWPSILVAVYPTVDEGRRQSALLAREFYDSQRSSHHPDEPDHPVDLAPYTPDWFEESMRPARDALTRPGADFDAGQTRMALAVAKEIENAGRRTILRAIPNDRLVKGWARVATGRETCAFCLMLISRGPVYQNADTAGLEVDDWSAAELWEDIANADTQEERQAAEQAMDEMMRKWHTGCDCKVVPVYDRRRWPGRDQWKLAEDIWKKHTKGYSGQDALNALRRAVDNGDVDPREVGVAA
jgi:hypothetical protein